MKSTPNPAPLSNRLAFHHLGLAVRRPQEAELFLSAQGYAMGETVLDPGQNVHLKMCTHATEPAVEIIWPSDQKGPIDSLTQRHPTGIVYHVCYTTENLTAALNDLEKMGLRVVCVSEPKPAPLFGGRMVSFYNVVGVGLIEILE